MRTIIHKMHSVSGGHSVGAGRHGAPWACCVGFERMSRRLTGVCVGRLGSEGHFSSRETGKSMCIGTQV